MKSLPTSTFTGFGATALTTAAMSALVADARRVEAVGAGFGVSGEPADRLREIRAGRR